MPRPSPSKTSSGGSSGGPTHLRRRAVRGGGTRLESAMVDTSSKSATARSAVARALVRFPAGVLGRLLAEGGPKGPIGEVARLAGIAAAKRTDELIPLCHGLALDVVEVALEQAGPDLLEVRCTARTVARTGVEMEAMVGASLAALAVYDMSKALDKGIVVERVELLEKRGGKSGAWKRPADAPARRGRGGRA